MKKNMFFLLAATLIFSACKKDPETTETPVVEDLTRTVLTSFSANVAQDVYADLYAQTNNLYTNVQLLSTETTDANLLACKQSWKDARLAWERSEAVLFGPVATENID